MEVWLLFLIMGTLTYVLIRRTVPAENKAPIGLLWLVMMLPSSAWLIWILVYGTEGPMPLLVMLPLLVISPMAYWSLIEWGKPPAQEKSKSAPEKDDADPDTDRPTEARDRPQKTQLPLTPEILLQGAQQKTKRPISSKEEEELRNCFPWGIFYLQDIDYFPQAVICKGKLRAVPQEAYQTIRDNVENLFGDRFIVVFQESFKGQPFFALVPNPWKAEQDKQPTESLTRPIMAIALAIITVFTATVMALQLQMVEPEALQQNPELLWQGLPYGFMIVVIFGLHELGHYFTGLYYKVKANLPCFVPIPFFVGTLGAYTQRKSPIPHRQALFDIAAAGSLIGMLITIPCLWIGLSLSSVVPLPEETTLLTLNEFDPRFSFLLALITRLAMGARFTTEMAIDLHPVAIAGYVGLMFGGMQLLPIGQLDGGLMSHAVFGQKTAAMIAQVTRIFMIMVALVQPQFLFLAIFAFFMPIANQPALNDVTDLDNRRDLFGIISMVFVAFIFLPLPGAIATWLNF